MHRALSGLLLILCLFASSLAQAGDDDSRARELYENGAILYEEGRYEDAIEAWQEAYRISKKPLLLFNIANAQERVGAWRDALESLNRYRAFAPADERDVLDRRMKNIERRVNEQEADDAEQRRLDEEAAQEEEEARAAEAAEAAAQEEEKQPTGGSSGGGAGPLRGLGAGLLIGGLVGAGVGGGLGGGALAKRQEIEGLCRDLDGSLFCPKATEALEAEESQLSLGGDLALIAGGALAGTGLVLMIVDAVAGTPKAAVLVPVPGGIAVAGRF